LCGFFQVDEKPGKSLCELSVDEWADEAPQRSALGAVAILNHSSDGDDSRTKVI